MLLFYVCITSSDCLEHCNLSTLRNDLGKKVIKVALLILFPPSPTPALAPTLTPQNATVGESGTNYNQGVCVYGKNTSVSRRVLILVHVGCIFWNPVGKPDERVFIPGRTQMEAMS